jgi:hypothetical protein
MRSSLIAVLIGLVTLVPETNAADLIVGADITPAIVGPPPVPSANRLFSFLTDGTAGNGTLDANYIALGAGAQGVTYDSVTNRIFATRGTATIAAFDYPSKTPVAGNPFSIPSPLGSASLRNLRMKADNSGLLSTQFNATPTGRVQSLSPTNPALAPSTTYSSVPSVHSVFQPSVGGFVYLMDINGDITRFDDNGANPTTISLTGKVASANNYRDIYFVDPTTFFVSVRATATGGLTGGVYKFTLSSASATTATLDSTWGSSGKAVISNATGLAASTDGTWLYVSAGFTTTSNMHSIQLTNGATNTLMSNIPGVYGYITVVPEPSTIVLVCLGGIAAFLGKRFRRQDS